MNILLSPYSQHRLTHPPIKSPLLPVNKGVDNKEGGAEPNSPRDDSLQTSFEFAASG